jgi:hypothetical protein
MTLVRDAGSETFATMLARTGGDWGSLDRLAEGLELRRAELPDPQSYQRLIDRLRQGDQRAFDELERAYDAQHLAQARAAGRVLEYARGRLRERNLRLLLEELDDIPPGVVKDQFAGELAQLSDRELGGLEQIARVDPHGVDLSEALRTLNSWGPGDRREFLELLSEVGPRCEEEGLESVLHGIFQRSVRTAGAEIHGVTGSYGQLYAARTAIRDLGATRLEFEVAEPGRVIDIVADTPHGRLSIEVKTNLQTTGDVIRREVVWDIVHHAGDDYRHLRYLYHPNVAAGDRAALGRRMLELFDDAEVRSRLTAAGRDPTAARHAFQNWLQDGGLGSYSVQ